jgi:ferric-dicitrate binding protein FerR (iron transport regulator)
MTQEQYIKLFQKFIQNEASSSEVKQLIAWLKNKSGFSDWADTQWETVSPDMEQKLKEKLFASVQEKIDLKRNYHLSFQQIVIYMAVASILVFVTGLTVYQYTIKSTQQPDMQVFVDKGQKAQINLPDGTAVWLNSDTRLTYGAQFNNKERSVQLEGEAYFEVAEDEDRPFTIQSGALSVEALGTHFNVRAYSEEKQLSATLLEGKVAVSTNTEKVILAPNQKAVWSNERQTLFTENIENASDYTLWIKNQLVFSGRSVEEIAHELERMYNMEVIFLSENIKHYRFSGTLNNSSLESILQIMSLTSPLVYHFEGNTILLNENRNVKRYYK